MNSIGVASIMFACAFGGVLVGMMVRAALPEHHVSSDSRDAIKQGVGLIATMSALILGLLIASAKSSYDSEKSEIAQLSAKVVFLDRLLAHYGAQTATQRAALRDAVIRAINGMWPEEKSLSPQLDPSASYTEDLLDAIHQLAPENDMQRQLKSQALGAAADLGQMRWLLYGQMGSSVSIPFLAVVMFWLTVIFISFGLFAPRNPTVLLTLLLCSLSVAGALFLILELDHPFDGLIQISSAPMRNAVEHLGR